MFITDLWKPQKAEYFFLCTRDISFPKDNPQHWQEHCFTRKEFKKIKPFIREHRDIDIYFCPHGFSKPMRKKGVAVLPSLLWADIDEADISLIRPRPSIAIQSSPGRYAGLWVTDKPITEELNKRLTYAIGADHGGWDVTQVLRLPGTRNYKPEYNKPRVKLLWESERPFKLKRLSRMLPEITEADGYIDYTEEDVAKLFKKYEKKMPHDCRRELLKGRPSRGNRSEMIWKLGNDLLEAGMSREEALTLLMASPWNKFADRSDGGIKQLTAELDKALNKKLHSPKKSSNKKPSTKKPSTKKPKGIPPGFMDINSVMMQERDYLLGSTWFARKEITIVEGYQGSSKSYFVLWLALLISRGKSLPIDDQDVDYELNNPDSKPEPVVFFDLENHISEVIKFRIATNGGSGPAPLYVYNTEDRDLDEDVIDMYNIDLTVEDDQERIIDALMQIKPSMVVFDTMTYFKGGGDLNSSADAGLLMTAFKRIASEVNCSVIAIRHVGKTKREARSAGMGSTTISGTARFSLTIGDHPDKPNYKAVSLNKTNSGGYGRAFSYLIESIPPQVFQIKDIHGDIIKKKVGKLSELIPDGWFEATADDILNTEPPEKEDKQNVNKMAIDILMDILSRHEGGIISIDLKSKFNTIRETSSSPVPANAFKRAIKTIVDSKKVGSRKKSAGRGKGIKTIYYLRDES